MRRSPSSWCALVVTLAWGAAAPAVAGASNQTGGAAVPGPPSVDTVTCVDGRPSVCAKGAALTLSGTDLQSVGRVAFLGGKGKRDDRATRPTTRTPAAVVVTVPPSAHSGPLVIETSGGRVRTARLRVTAPAGLVAATPSRLAAPSQGDDVFPIAGAHTYGQSAANRFGGARGHQGQDVFAACGTPLVATGEGTVIKAAFQANAGNYVVIQRADGTSNAYMHMRAPAAVSAGATVTGGQRLGVVGETGRATGCHLHFELWTAPGWYRGGHAIDPLGTLRGWDAGA